VYSSRSVPTFRRNLLFSTLVMKRRQHVSLKLQHVSTKLTSYHNRGQSTTVLTAFKFRKTLTSFLCTMRGPSKNLYKTDLTFNVSGAESLSRSQYFLSLSVISPVLWNRKSHYRLQKNLLPVLVLSQVNPSHILPPHSFGSYI
jgi:hypothetical protein